jgi:uncharacterized membrane protein YidH (DUF202 family)
VTPRPAPPEEMEDIDPGLAHERTELAWTRTAISFAALGGAVLKTAGVVGVPVLATSALIWAIGRLPRSTQRPGTKGRRRLLLLITVAVAAASLVALLATLMGGKSSLIPR